MFVAAFVLLGLVGYTWYKRFPWIDAAAYAIPKEAVLIAVTLLNPIIKVHKRPLTVLFQRTNIAVRSSSFSAFTVSTNRSLTRSSEIPKRTHSRSCMQLEW